MGLIIPVMSPTLNVLHTSQTEDADADVDVDDSDDDKIGKRQGARDGHVVSVRSISRKPMGRMGTGADAPHRSTRCCNAVLHGGAIHHCSTRWNILNSLLHRSHVTQTNYTVV